MDPDARSELLRLARATLEVFLSTRQIPEYTPRTEELLLCQGAFVSLHHGTELRGCIGQIIVDREVYHVVQYCAVAAATEDSRFAPVTAEELPLVRIEISLLSPFTRVTDVSAIEVGRHGLMVTLGRRRGLLLPQVPGEYGWDREAFLIHTCRKAGLADNAWRDPTLRIESFEAEVFSE